MDLTDYVSAFLSGVLCCLLALLLASLFYTSDARMFVKKQCLEMKNEEACKIMGDYYEND